ncbi:MAG TPA: NmrA family NAD(P)-binding protein [Thermoanaerobaculia bacterium]|nr:NmrA family NAD(P)-binding protein [Thermoanaerobaculia bacterium]
MKNRLILLIGTTAEEGESLTRRLIPRGFDVRLATPAPDSDLAQTLRELGAEVVPADLDDRASLRAALRGCWGVFAAASPEQQRTLATTIDSIDIEQFACRLTEVFA